MLEQEIKLHVPAAARAGVLAELDTAGRAGRIRLRAMYFDTADRQLARQRAAVRLRLEGRRWVQTFKMAGHDALSRVEIEHPRPRPELDLSVYAGTPAEALFARLDAPLVMRYETDVRRVLRRVRLRTGTVELAYDTGCVRAGDLELAINELEIERVSGRLDAVFTCADRWLRGHGLLLDLRSKAERGDALAEAAARIAAAPLDQQAAVRAEVLAPFGAPRKQRRPHVGRHASAAEALDAITVECLDQIARNAALATGLDVPAGAEDASVEAVHQLRVGIRRLRSAWRLFEGWTPLPEGTLQDGARELFGAMGVARDRDVLDGTVLPRLEAAGMPPLPTEPAPDAHIATLAGGLALQRWLLAMHAWAAGVRATPALAVPAGTAMAADDVPATASPPHEPPLRTRVRKRLRKWHERVLRDALRVDRLDDEDRHTLRKRAKRLRYGIDLAGDLLGKKTGDYRKRLAVLQDVLGEANDLAVVRESLRERSEAHPQAWFGLGWIAQRLDVLVDDAHAAARSLARARRFWK